MSRRPSDSPFYQQRLKAWQPILTPKYAIITFSAVGIAFVAIGFGLKAANDAVVELSQQVRCCAAAAGGGGGAGEGRLVARRRAQPLARIGARRASVAPRGACLRGSRVAAE